MAASIRFPATQSRLQFLLKDSAVVAFLERSEAEWKDGWAKSRPPTSLEIQALEKRGSDCPDWQEFRILGSGSLDFITNCQFVGQNLLVLDEQGPRLHHSRFQNCRLGSADIDSSFLDQVWVESGAKIWQVGELSGEAHSHYCLGLAIHPGDETGSRRVFLWDGMLFSDCEAMVELPPSEQSEVAQAIEVFLKPLKTRFSYVGTGASIQLTRTVANAFIGPGTFLKGANSIRRCLLLSSPEAPTQVLDGAWVEDSVLEPGSGIKSGGQVSRSLLIEGSLVEGLVKSRIAFLAPIPISPREK